MTDLNDVKAGKYQLVAPRWDQITSKPGEPLDYVRHRRGAIVELSSEDAKRLVHAGAVVKPGELEKQRVEAAKALAERAAAEYQAVLAGLPDDVRQEVAPATDPGNDGGSGSKEPTIQEVLDQVGDDLAKATAALEAEQAKGEGARSTLVTKLQAIVTPAS